MPSQANVVILIMILNQFTIIYIYVNICSILSN